MHILAHVPRIDDLLRYIHAHLDQELALGVLAARAGVSPFHFHRLFKSLTGETPAKYVERVRLDQAAEALLLHDITILGVALDHGYEVAETFSRSFRRRFGLPPREYRRRGRLQGSKALPDRSSVDSPSGRYEISRTRVVKMRSTLVACKRVRGPYENVSSGLWDEIEIWLGKRNIRGTRYIGVGHDNPGADSRYDAGVIVEVCFDGDDSVFCWKMPSGPYAVTSHVGPYSTLSDAIPKIYQQALAIEDFRVIGLPLIELYHSTRMRSDRLIEQTDVYIPIVDRVG